MAVHFPLSLYLLVFWLLPIIYYLCWDLFVLQKVILLRRIHFKMSSGLYFPKISNNYLSPREYSCFIAPLFVETVNSHFCPSPPFSCFLLQARFPGTLSDSQSELLKTPVAVRQLMLILPCRGWVGGNKCNPLTTTPKLNSLSFDLLILQTFLSLACLKREAFNTSRTLSKVLFSPLTKE